MPTLFIMFCGMFVGVKLAYIIIVVVLNRCTRIYLLWNVNTAGKWCLCTSVDLAIEFYKMGLENSPLDDRYMETVQ